MDDVQSIWTHWHGHPDVLIGLTVLQGAYLLAIGPLAQANAKIKIESLKVVSFTLGMLIISIALLSPVHILSDTYLFSAHMVQHILLTLAAPPLLIYGTPDWMIRPLLRPRPIFRFARLATHPVSAFFIFSFIFSLWHIPSLYNLSVTNHGIHIIEHLVFIFTAMLVWWPIMSPLPELPRLSYPSQMAYLFLLSIAQLIIFAPITFSNDPLYQFYVNAPRIWNISPLADQQIGGIIMKMSGAVIFLALIVIVFFRWYKEEESSKQLDLDSLGYPGKE